MLYIHDSTCISPQQSFQQADLNTIQEPVNNMLKAIEPAYEGIPPGMLRRMGTAIRLGVGAALSLLKNNTAPDGIIIGTARGGMEDCIKFLNQIVEYEEGVLAPGNFVQSTTNAIAGTLGLISHNRGYNITHTHRGLAFENALIDALLQLHDHPDQTYLLGGVDEISSFNYNLERLSGAYKAETVNSQNFYTLRSEGSIAGEAAAMFLVNSKKENAVCKLKWVSTLHSRDEQKVNAWMQDFISAQLSGQHIDLLLSGENGDARYLPFYEQAELLLTPGAAVARFKHLCGEFPTAVAFAVWLCTMILRDQSVPDTLFKKAGSEKIYKNILLYNNLKGSQHSLLLITLP